MPKHQSVLEPNLGLHLGVSALTIPNRALSDGNNFRIKQGLLSNLNLGWTRFGEFTLNGPVSLINGFFLSGGTEHLVFATLKDIYKYDAVSTSVSFLTPRYATGTVAVSNADPAIVTGTGTTWSTNVSTGDEIHFTDATQTDPDAVWYIIDTVDSNTQLTLTTTVAGAPLNAGTIYTARKLFTGRIFEPWEATTFLNASPGNADLWFATNGVNDVVTWDGSANQVTLLTGLGFTAKHLTVYNNMMIYGNVTQGGTLKPTTIINSDLGNPEDTSSGLASQFVIHDGTDEIEGLNVLGENLVIYSNRHVILSQFVGDPLVFVFRAAITGIGPISGRAVADFGDFHEFLGADSQYRFDGASVSKINKHVWRDVLRTRDPERHPLIFHHFDEESGDLIWAIPLVTDVGSGETDTTIEVAYSEHYLEDTKVRNITNFGIEVPHSKRSFPFTASGYFTRQSTLTWDQIGGTWEDLNFRWNDQFFTVAFPLNMVGNIDGKIYTLGTSQNADAAALVSFVRFNRRALSDGRTRGMISRVYPFATEFPSATYNLDVTLHLSDHASGASTPSAVFGLDLTLPEGDHFVSPFRSARYVEIQFGTAGPGEPWELAGYAVDVKPGGVR